MNIPLLRVLNQQLLRPQFCDPAELVSWMGGIQAQDLHWMKWALGVRLRSSGIDKIDKALKQGEILRLHIMRPTWHFVAARDIRWMLKLSTERIERAYLSYARSCGLNLPAELPGKGCALLEKILAGQKNLTVAEIIEPDFPSTNRPCGFCWRLPKPGASSAAAGCGREDASMLLWRNGLLQRRISTEMRRWRDWNGVISVAVLRWSGQISSGGPA